MVTIGDGTLAMKSNGLPEWPPLSDCWRKSERLDDGARDPGGVLANVACVCLVERGMQ